MKKHTLIITSLFFASSFAWSDVLKPDDLPGESTDRFGSSLAISGNDLFIGSNIREDYDTKYSTYIYNDNNGEWSYQKTTSTGGGVKDAFGDVLDVSGNMAVIGASRETVSNQSFAGAVYIYEKVGDTWSMTSKITAPSPGFMGYFGYTVGISGGNMVLSTNSTSAGSDIYFYTKNGSDWTGEKIGNVQYGGTTAISGEIVVAGSQKDGTNYTGAIYIYEKKGGEWSSQKITASDAATGSYFGNAVAIDGETIIAGSSAKSSNKGGAYIYTKNGDSWDEYILKPSDYGASTYFGNSVDISGNVAIVGAFHGNNMGAGGAYIYTKNGETWSEVKITASTPVASGGFGADVAIDGDRFAIGSNSMAQVFTGSVSSITTLDDRSSKSISGINFVSQQNWIIGEHTSGNTVLVGSDVSATVKASGMAVYIGKNGGSNNNTLILQGKISASKLYVGSIDGNSGNILRFDSSANWASLSAIFLAEGNGIIFEKEWSSELDLFTLLDRTVLNVYDTVTGSWVAVSESNYSQYLEITATETGGMSVVMPKIPEPAGFAAALSALALAFVAYRKKIRRKK